MPPVETLGIQGNIMQYQFSIRKITESDLNVYRPFMPENEHYEMHLSAFAEDIESLEFVTELRQNDNNFIITIESEPDFNQLHAAIRNLLNGSYHDKLVVNLGFSKVT